MPAVASALWADQPQSICDLPAPSGNWNFHIAARLVVHARGAVLADPACPGRTMLIEDLSPIRMFLAQADPDGKRFGSPGDGTHVNIVLRGQADSERVAGISDVDAYSRYDVIDRRWRIRSTEESVHSSNWLADEQFPFSREPRTLKSSVNYTTVHSGLRDDDVTALLKLSRAESGTLCQVSESAESLVRLQCNWPMKPGNLKAWVYSREGNSWRLLQTLDTVTH